MVQQSNKGPTADALRAAGLALLPAVFGIHSCCLNTRSVHREAGFFVQTCRGTLERYCVSEKVNFFRSSFSVFVFAGKQRELYHLELSKI